MLRQAVREAPLQRLSVPAWEQRGVEVSIWRLDRIAVAAPGNKIFKLDENFRAARSAGCTRVLSFGGVFSNHLHALAQYGAHCGFETVGIVRGEATAAANPTLQDAVAAGMQLHFVERGLYRRICRSSDIGALSPQLQAAVGPCHVIPEGGANPLGVVGCAVLGNALRERAENWDCIALPCATGTTLAGLIAGLDGAAHALGIAVLKGGAAVAADVQSALAGIDAAHCARWAIDGDFHCGGYARVTPELQHFIDNFQRLTAVPIEPVYSGKMLYAIHRRIERGDFARGTRLLALHTGGLQGARGFNYRNRRDHLNNQQTDKAAFHSLRLDELHLHAAGEIVRDD